MLYTSSVVHKSCRCTMPSSFPTESTTISEVIFFSSIKAKAVAANSEAAIVFGLDVIASPAVRSITSLPRFSSKRRKSPSEITPRNRPDSCTVVMPEREADDPDSPLQIRVGFDADARTITISP